MASMNNDTNRLAQLIATAADKELGTRPDGQPRRQDKAAAQAIEAEYLFIRRADLPTAEIVDRDGVPHVDVGSDAGTWSCKTSSADYAPQNRASNTSQQPKPLITGDPSRKC